MRRADGSLEQCARRTTQTRPAAARPARRHRFWSAVLVAIATTQPLPAVAQSATDTADSRDRRLDQIRREIGAERSRLGAARERVKALRTALVRSEKQATVVRRRMRQISAELTSNQQTLETLGAERQREGRRLEGLQRELGQELREAYGRGRRDYLRLLLNQSTGSRLARLMAYHGYVSRARGQRIATVRDGIAIIAGTERRAEAEAARLDILLRRARAADTQLDTERSRRQDLLVRLEREMAAAALRLEELQANEQALASVVSRVEQADDNLDDAAGAELPSFGAIRGQLPWPARGRLRQRYSSRAAPENLHWQGVFLEAAHAEPVIAVSAGRVAFADWIRGFGQVVIVEHGDGFMSLYGHLSEILQEPGAWVQAGDQLGSVGDTGGQPDPGLYFEIRRDGQPQSPERWCRGSPSRAVARARN
ncbi:MAG: peptidoglycan DD-metalloendopeptidase family protein [Pseudomonadota bacterium]